MVWLRFCILIAGAFALDLFLFVFFPTLRMVMDPFFLLLVFLGFRGPSRFVWMWGLGLGFLKDLTGGAFLGGMPMTFALIGWLLTLIRRFVEEEDAFVVGIWAGILTLFKEALYAGFLFLAAPGGHLTLVGWMWVFLSLGVNGVAASLSFPVLAQFLEINRSSAWVRLVKS